MTKKKTPREIEDAGAIVEIVREELKKCRGRWSLLSELSEGVLSRKWLTAFAAGRIKDPAFTRLSKLAPFLGMSVRMREDGRHYLRFGS